MGLGSSVIEEGLGEEGKEGAGGVKRGLLGKEIKGGLRNIEMEERR